MVKTLAIKFLFKQITKILERRYNLKKMHDYVVKPNELDKQVKQIQKTLSKHGKYIESNDKDIAILNKDSHPAQEYICCRKCGCKIAKTKK